jgi:hypothetical protein
MKSTATADRPQPLVTNAVRSGSPIAWTPNHELDAQEWVAAGRRIGTIGRCIQWLLGDWIAYGNLKFGERYARASQITGYDPQTLMNMVYVASRFAASRRREILSWSHHETLAALEQAEQDLWLDRAVAHRWSVSDLRMMLRTSRKRLLVKLGESEIESNQDGPESPEVEPAHRQKCGPEQQSPRRGPTVTASGKTLSLFPSHMTCPHCGREISLRNSDM